MTWHTVRFVAAVFLVASLAGIGVCDIAMRQWKTALLGLLFAAGNVIIFLWKE